MPQGFPGRPRARRLSLRRTTRYPSSRYVPSGSAGRFGRSSSMTRRGVLTAIALVGLGGATDVIRSLATGGRARVGNPRSLGAARSVAATGRPTTPSPTLGSTPSTLPAHSLTPTPGAGHSHAPLHNHGAHGHAHSHGHGHHDHAKRIERAKLPPTRLEVRTRPAYAVTELIHDPPKHAIALTIDDGPDPEWTPHVLRLLDKFNMQASFCVVGEHADAYPRLVRDVARAGHVVVNHSYTHALPFTNLPQKRIVWEITKTQRAIERAAGVTPQLFRAPGGDWSRFIFRALAAYGLEPLDWDVDPRDWALPGTKVIERRMLQARPGEIVLCHDGGGNRSETVQALTKVLPVWKRRGYVTIPLQVTPHYLPKPTNSPRSSTSPSSTPSGSSTTTPTVPPTS